MLRLVNRAFWAIAGPWRWFSPVTWLRRRVVLLEAEIGVLKNALGETQAELLGMPGTAAALDVDFAAVKNRLDEALRENLALHRQLRFERVKSADLRQMHAYCAQRVVELEGHMAVCKWLEQRVSEAAG